MRLLLALFLFGCSKPSAPVPRAAAPPGQTEILNAMTSIQRKVASCADEHKRKGMAMLHVTVEPEGTVTSVATTGELAGTPTGTCIEEVVRKVRFQPFPGAPVTFDFPFLVR